MFYLTCPICNAQLKNGNGISCYSSPISSTVCYGPVPQRTLAVPEYRRPVLGTIILGLVLIGIGLGDIIGWAVLWAVILIVIGLSILLRGFFPRQRE